jgi:tetratricopeptide (TPR) repeat protein
MPVTRVSNVSVNFGNYHMKRFTLSLAILFCLLALMPAASPIAAKDNWISVRSKNFLLVGNASEKQVRQVAVRLEQFREVFSHLFPGAVISTPVPTTVVVFKSDSSYGPFKPNPNIAGYFQSGDDVNYITLLAEVRGQQDPFTIIFHEYTHLMVNNTLGNVPTWFNEGLAEFYSTFSISDDQKVVLGAPISSHVYLLRQKKMLPLRTLFQVDPKSPYYNERDKQGVFYAESWALLHYLIMGKNGERVAQMGKFVEATARNVPMEDAFQQAFAMTFEDMEKELKEYIKNDRYRIISGHFERKLEVQTDMQAAPITESQAQAYLGDLLLHLNAAAAEAYLQKALSLDPDLAMAHASLAMLRVRQGRTDEALKSLERAAAADTQSYLIHYYYAYALSRAGKDSNDLVLGYSAERVSKMRAALDKAIALRPDFVESYSLLAFVNLVTGSRLDESIAMLKKAQSLARGRNDLSFMLAQLYVAKRDHKSAREMLQKINASNSRPELVQSAQSLSKEIASLEEHEASLRDLRQRNSSDRSVLPATDRSEQTEFTPPDASSYLRDALRKPQVGETQAQGTLVRIDCDGKGMTFVIRLSDRLIKLRASSFESVDMTSFSADSGGQITCGPRKPENNVVVLYAGSTDARPKVDGIAKSLEFVPPDFKLKP